MAKEDILAAIRNSLAASAPFDAVHAEHQALHVAESQPTAKAPSDKSREEVISRFRENLEQVGGKCTVVKSQAEAAASMQKIVEALKPKRIAVSDSPSARSIAASLNTDAEILEKAPAQALFDCDIGITCAQWAIAETGTLVLESEREFNRLTSLVPEVHVCILEEKNIRQTMGEILEIVAKDLSPTVTFITGPSRTSDIELTLAIGVHGPRELHVTVIDEVKGENI